MLKKKKEDPMTNTISPEDCSHWVIVIVDIDTLFDSPSFSFLISGKWKCCRVRFEVNNLFGRSENALLKRYMETYAKMTRHEMTQKDYKAIVEAHRTLFLAGIHTLPSFGAWHRWYLLQVCLLVVTPLPMSVKIPLPPV